MDMTTVRPEVEALSTRTYLASHMRDYGMLLALVLIVLFFQFMTGAETRPITIANLLHQFATGTLMRPVNITNLFLQNSYIVVMAAGMLLVIVAGHIDLSVGSVVGFVGALAAVMLVHWKLPVAAVFPLSLLCGIVIGAAQGYWIAYWRIPSFIVTLAGMLVFKGLALAVLQGQSVGPFPTQFQLISSGFIPDFFAVDGLRLTSLLLGVAIAVVMFVSRARSRRSRISYGMEEEPWPLFLSKNLVFAALIVFLSYLLSSYKGLPNVLIVMGGLMLLYDFATNRTTIGRRVYALGGNAKAAKLSGIKTERLAFYTFVNMGVLAALAGLVFAARLNTATPKAGLGFELDVIAACFIGGASASGGVGKVMGAVIGAFIMGVMNNGMSILGVGIDYQQVIKGLVLLAAVYVDVYNKNK
jgi:putative multiple sugar transport system permease protein